MEDFFEKENYIEEDIIQLIENEAEESIHLDFKAAGALGKNYEKKKEICKDVSAFANSDGGTIIYGIFEDNHKASSLSFIDGNEYTKEWLEQIINSNIQRKIEGLLVLPVRFDNSIQKTVYVVKVPISPEAPHLAADKRFYKRYNFESVRMEEYEIRNLYNRKLNTELIIEDIDVDSQVNFTKSRGKLSYLGFNIKFQIKNIGKVIENQYKVEIAIPRRLIRRLGKMPEIDQHYIRSEQNLDIFSIPNRSPVFQGELTTIISCDIEVNITTILLLTEPGIKMKLYYSSGVSEKNIDLLQKLRYEGRKLDPSMFSI